MKAVLRKIITPLASLFIVFPILISLANASNNPAIILREGANIAQLNAINIKCHRWKRVCSGPVRCMKYSYAYSGCHTCSLFSVDKYNRYTLVNRIQTCQQSRARYLHNAGWSCKVYYYNQNSPYSDRFCVKWTRNCRYICAYTPTAY